MDPWQRIKQENRLRKKQGTISVGAKVTILDLGINNINSVKRTFQRQTEVSQVEIIKSYSDYSSTHLVVLPGLGSFFAGMQSLKDRNLDEYLRKTAELGVPIVGVCLGMQLLGFESEESPGIKGLGLIEGKNELLPINSSERIPNIGWMGGTPANDGNLFPALASEKDFYFVHSYHFIPENTDNSIFKSNYGNIEITTAIKKENILGFQFHPEKSSQIGNQLIGDTIRWAINEN